LRLPGGGKARATLESIALTITFHGHRRPRLHRRKKMTAFLDEAKCKVFGSSSFPKYPRRRQSIDQRIGACESILLPQER
jgi:hypothetical protein